MFIRSDENRNDCLVTNLRGKAFGISSLNKISAVTYSSVIAWRIPRMEEPDRLQPMGPHRVGHD